jgi:predicted metal-binding membrane protein
MSTNSSFLSLAKKTLTVWFVMMCVEFVHGTMRTIFLLPRIGDFTSRQVGAFTGSLLIFFVAYLFAPWFGSLSKRAALTIGAAWVVLTVIFELSLGIFVLDLSPERMFRDFDVARGALFPFALLFLFFCPLLVARLRGL